MVVQILLYGCENLTLWTQEGRRNEPAKLKILRSDAGYNWLEYDEGTNEEMGVELQHT
jgi:hypothetical protein